MGVNISADARVEVAALVGGARENLPGAKWVRENSYHLTLVFLGNVEETILPRVNEALASATAGRPSFSIQLCRSGIFPEKRRPVRALWIGLADGEPIVDLQRAIARELSDTGLINPEDRRFHPHLTVARCRRPWPRSAGEAWCSLLDGPLGEPFGVERCVLFRSHLRADGAHYEPLRTYSLDAES